MVLSPVIQSQSINLPRWEALITRIEIANTPTHAMESAAEAEGYLCCLHDVGLVSIYQRNKMANELQAACIKQLERIRFGYPPDSRAKRKPQREL